MSGEVLLPHLGDLDMGVDLRRRDVRMAEHLLDGAKIGAPFEKMGRERMAQGVGMKILDVRATTGRDDDRMDALPRQAPSARIEENGGIRRGIALR